MLEIEKPKLECVESAEDGSYGKFVIEPLERGYGITLGNSLRRILLSSLPGAAVFRKRWCPQRRSRACRYLLNFQRSMARAMSKSIRRPGR